ncbi:MAG: hypothetical protein QG603_475 [Patescibacteria group bacterium]|nr:hypothetical protein [Patescibacteria group bacterium]
MRFAVILIVCGLLLASNVLAYSKPGTYFQESEEKYQCLLRGTGVIEPPYEEAFQFLLIYEPGYLHFVFDHPFDPDQEGELAEYQAEYQLTWSVCYFELEGHTWSVVTMSVTGAPQEQAQVFLDHLRNLSFIRNLSPFGTQEQASR